MSYTNGKVYWITPQNNPDVSLGTTVNRSIEQNSNVYLMNKQNISYQLWRLEVLDGYARLKILVNETFALNIWRGSSSFGNCDIHTWANNTEDSKINLVTVDANQNLYLIQCYSNMVNDLYLTADGTTNGANVKWANRNSELNKVWKLIEKTDVTTTTSINLPDNRTYNWSQFHQSITAICDQAGCSLTCLLDIANIFGPSCYSANDIYQVCGWNNQGISSWKLPSNCAGWIDLSGYSGGSSSRSNILNVTKKQIQANNPVILKLRSSKSGNTHFVVAYAFTNQGNSISDFYVLDPGSGEKCALIDAMSYNYSLDIVQNYILSQRR